MGNHTVVRPSGKIGLVTCHVVHLALHSRVITWLSRGKPSKQLRHWGEGGRV